jgi:hypothetical protein
MENRNLGTRIRPALAASSQFPPSGTRSITVERNYCSCTRNVQTSVEASVGWLRTLGSGVHMARRRTPRNDAEGPTLSPGARENTKEYPMNNPNDPRRMPSEGIPGKGGQQHGGQQQGGQHDPSRQGGQQQGGGSHQSGQHTQKPGQDEQKR